MSSLYSHTVPAVDGGKIILPFYSPRQLTVKQLDEQLRQRKLSTAGKKAVLAGRLQDQLVKEYQQIKWDLSMFNKQQPEYWIFLAEKAHRMTQQYEPNPVERFRLAKEANFDLTTKQNWFEAADIEMTDRISAIRVLQSSSAITPTIIWTAESMVKRPLDIIDSTAQLSIAIGAMSCPEHWTEAYLLKH